MQVHKALCFFIMVVHSLAAGIQTCTTDTSVFKRNTRGIYIIGKEVLQSIKAMKNLKKDAKPVIPEQYKANLYSKEGGFSQAMKDFNSFQPTSVADCFSSDKGYRKWAFVGDRTICLDEVGESGKPTLQIFRGLGTSSEKLDTFVYGP